MHDLPIIEVFGLNLDISSIVMIIVSSIIVFLLARAAARNASVENPGKLQSFMEWVIDFVRNIVGNAMDMKKGKAYVSLALTLIMFIFVANMLGLPFSIVTEHDKPFTLFGSEVVSQAQLDELAAEDDGHGEVHLLWWKSPTADVSVSMGLSLMVILLAHLIGLTKSTKGYLKHYFDPYWFFLPLNIIKELSKLLTLGMRLFGNIFAGEILISTILLAGFLGIVPLLIWQSFSLFVGAIQAFIFTVLAMVYISQTVVHDEEH